MPKLPASTPSPKTPSARDTPRRQIDATLAQINDLTPRLHIPRVDTWPEEHTAAGRAYRSKLGLSPTAPSRSPLPPERLIPPHQQPIVAAVNTPMLATTLPVRLINNAPSLRVLPENTQRWLRAIVEGGCNPTNLAALLCGPQGADVAQAAAFLGVQLLTQRSALTDAQRRAENPIVAEYGHMFSRLVQGGLDLNLRLIYSERKATSLAGYASFLADEEMAQLSLAQSKVLPYAFVKSYVAFIERANQSINFTFGDPLPEFTALMEGSNFYPRIKVRQKLLADYLCHLRKLLDQAPLCAQPDLTQMLVSECVALAMANFDADNKPLFEQVLLWLTTLPNIQDHWQIFARTAMLAGTRPLLAMFLSMQEDVDARTEVYSRAYNYVSAGWTHYHALAGAPRLSEAAWKQMVQALQTGKQNPSLLAVTAVRNVDSLSARDAILTDAATKAILADKPTRARALADLARAHRRELADKLALRAQGLAAQLYTIIRERCRVLAQRRLEPMPAVATTAGWVNRLAGYLQLWSSVEAAQIDTDGDDAYPLAKPKSGKEFQQDHEFLKELCDVCQAFQAFDLDTGASCITGLSTMVLSYLQPAFDVASTYHDSFANYHQEASHKPSWRGGIVFADALQHCNPTPGADVGLAALQQASGWAAQLPQALQEALAHAASPQGHVVMQREIAAAIQPFEGDRSDAGFKLFRGLEAVVISGDVDQVRQFLAQDLPFSLTTHSSAFALALRMRHAARDTKNRVEITSAQGIAKALLLAAKTEASVLVLLHTAFGLLDPWGVDEVLAHAKARKIRFWQSARPEDAQLLHLAAGLGEKQFCALLQALTASPNLSTWLQWQDGQHDSLLHVTARGQGACVKALLAAADSKNIELPWSAINSDGRRPLDEALAYGNASTYRALGNRDPARAHAEPSIVREALVDGFGLGDASAFKELAELPWGRAMLAELTEDLAQDFAAMGAQAAVHGLREALEARPEAERSLKEPAVRKATPKAKVIAPSAVLTPRLNSWATRILLAGKHSAAREAVIAQFLASTAPDAMTEQAMDPDAYRNAQAQGRDILDVLRATGRGRLVGAHFLSHRPRLKDAALLSRLVEENKPGSSRFGVDDSLAMLRCRKWVLEAAQLTLASRQGRYAIDVRDACLSGHGWVREMDGEIASYTNSTLLRFIVEVNDASVISVVTFHPIPPSNAAATPLRQFRRV